MSAQILRELPEDDIDDADEDYLIVYELDDMKEVTPIPSLNLPDLTVSQCLQPKDGSRYMVFFCTAAKKYEGPCPCCGSVTTPPIKSGFLKPDRLVHDVMEGRF